MNIDVYEENEKLYLTPVSYYDLRFGFSKVSTIIGTITNDVLNIVDIVFDYPEFKNITTIYLAIRILAYKHKIKSVRVIGDIDDDISEMIDFSLRCCALDREDEK